MCILVSMGVTGGFDGMQRDCGIWNTSVLPMHTGCKPATAEMILALGVVGVKHTKIIFIDCKILYKKQ